MITSTENKKYLYSTFSQIPSERENSNHHHHLKEVQGITSANMFPFSSRTAVLFFLKEHFLT